MRGCVLLGTLPYYTWSGVSVVGAVGCSLVLGTMTADGFWTAVQW